MGEVLVQSLLGGILGLLGGYAISYFLGFLSVPIFTPWEVTLVPAFAKDTKTTAEVVRLPVSLSVGSTASSLALSLMAGGLRSYLMARRASAMKSATILRKM
jgi:ABC-type antimicrobial peptide transport system permease subunit